MRILFLSDNFPPEVNAPASRTFEHCREWVRLGAEVTVITSAPNFPQGRVYPGYRNRLLQEEQMEGIRVLRVWTYIAPNQGFLLRIFDYLSFALSATITALFQRADIIVATSPQLFTACSGLVAATLQRKPWVFEVRDLWPESIQAVGAIEQSPVIRLLERLERFLYRNASHIVVVTESFKARIADRSGVAPEKISIVKNGVDSTFFAPGPTHDELRSRLGLQGKYVVGYIGTHGMAHALDFILKSAEAFRLDPELQDLHFLLIGDGAEKQSLLALKEQLSLTNVSLLPPVQKSEVPAYLRSLDAALVNLKRSDTFLQVLPSKIFEAAAVGLPILLGVDGEARRLIERYRAGVAFIPDE